MFCQEKKLPWVVLALAIFASQALWHAIDKSATYDEPAHLTVSYLLAATDHTDYEIGHPPFIRVLFGLPLRFLKPSLPNVPAPMVSPDVPLSKRPPGMLYAYSNLFVYFNRVPHNTLLLFTRIVSIVLGCILGVMVWLFSCKLYGERAGSFSLWVFALSPSLIAHGSLVTTDMGGITTAIGALWACYAHLKKPSNLTRVLSGVALGLAISSKYTNLILPLIFVGVIALEYKNRQAVKEIAWVGLISWVILCALYGFDRVFSPHLLPPQDWEALGKGKLFQALYQRVPLPDTFIRGILYNTYHNLRGHAAFFLGEYSAGGWKLYFPFAFLIKTPVTMLLLILTSLVFLFRSLKSFRNVEWLIHAPVLVLVSYSINSNTNIGLRHILLIYPLLAIWLGKLMTQPFFSTKKGEIVSCAIIAALACENFSIAPHYLSYFNLASGGADKGIKYLSDSNIDWGQDLKRLSKFLKREKGEALLSYFGTAVPMAHDIRAQSLPTVMEYPQSLYLNSVKPEREFIAVSVTNLQATYFGNREIYRWLLDKQPVEKIGHSIYVYDITQDLEAQKKILEIYRMTGDQIKYNRQFERVKLLEEALGP